MNEKLNSLGIAKPPSETRVVVAMSGGVDSSVAAALLHEEGYDVVGVTLQLYDDGATRAPENNSKDKQEASRSERPYGKVKKSKTCCAGQDIYDARRVAENLGFPHYVLNYESNFRDSVIDDFADSYIKGQTPIPCVKCNQTVKFRDLLETAHDLGADCMATGHYIKRTINDNGVAELHRAHDFGKDQSYFLFATTQEQLDFLRFPLGAWSKDKTREEAERLGLLTADKAESMDICFVPDGDYAKIVKKIRPEAANPGDIVHVDGRVVAKHEGIIHYTIGQRKGIGIGGGVSENNSPLYVIRLDPEKNQVIVGPKESLARTLIDMDNCNWLAQDIIDQDFPDGGLPIALKFRSIMKPIEARLSKNNTGATIKFDTPQYGIAPGQAAVIYAGDRMLGGGWITGSRA